MRRLVPVLLALALSGCNLVYSERPLFTERDTRSVPTFRTGLWLMPSREACAVDTAKPADQWPDCADHTVVTDGRTPFQEDGGLLAGGRPLIYQYPQNDDGKPVAWFYAAVTPTQQDAEGRVIAAAPWPVVCGPPPPDGNKLGPDGEERYVTLHPLPGLQIRENNCVARKAGVVRNAARASLAWAGQISEMRWVRDGDR